MVSICFLGCSGWLLSLWYSVWLLIVQFKSLYDILNIGLLEKHTVHILYIKFTAVKNTSSSKTSMTFISTIVYNL